MAYHECWAIVGKGGTICHDDEGRFTVYVSESVAIQKAADFMKAYPGKTFTIKKTRIPLPWA